MNEVAKHGGMSVVHAEDDAIARWLTAQYIREGKTHGAYICEVRGPLVEEAATRRALSGVAGQFDSVIVRKDGQRRYITVNYACPQRSQEVLCVIRDATSEKQLQQQLIQSEKMAAIGAFSEKNVKSGVVVMTGGLVRPSRGIQLRCEQGKVSVTDGPFAETKELIDGFALVEVASREEAIRVSSEFMQIAGDESPNLRYQTTEATAKLLLIFGLLFALGLSLRAILAHFGLLSRP